MLSVLLIGRNAELPLGRRYRVLSSGRCLAGMVRRAATVGVNLAGLFRATERQVLQSPLRQQLSTEDGKKCAALDQASATPMIATPAGLFQGIRRGLSMASVICPASAQNRA